MIQGTPNYSAVIVQYQNGSVYTGPVDSRFRRRGQGRLEFGPQSAYMSYEGRFDCDDFEGEGLLLWRDGKRYQGVFSRSKFNGRGRLTTTQNTIDGDFEDGKLIAARSCQFTNGDSYAGAVSDGIIHGKGKYSYQNGAIYEGEFSHGKKEDEQGKMAFGDGELKGAVYQGMFRNDKLAGKGTIKSSEIAITGSFGNNYLDGRASIERKGIGTLEGEYQDNMKHGDFTFTRADSGKKCQTFFQYDVEDTSVHKFATRF